MDACAGTLLYLALLMEASHTSPLIRDLGHPSFRVREKASRRAVELQPRIRPLLVWNSHHRDPEVALRCRRALHEWDLQPFYWRPTNYPYMPQFDMIRDHTTRLPPPAVPTLFGEVSRSDLYLTYFYSDAAQALVPQTNIHLLTVLGPDYSRWRLATALYVSDLRRAGYSRARIQQFLDDLVPIEKAWYKQLQRTPSQPQVQPPL